MSVVSVADTLLDAYQSSPPALLGVLTVSVVVGGRHALQRIRSIEDKLDTVTDRLDNHEILLDHMEDRQDRARKARRRNEDRIIALKGSETAAQGFQQRAEPQSDPDTGDSGQPNQTDNGG